MILLDCGDGSIHRLVKSKTDLSSISDILITHYHSDHLTGLTSIIETMAIRKRSAKLRVFGPRGLKDYFSMVEKTTNVAFNRKFDLELSELSFGDGFSLSDYRVSAFEMDHTIPCVGYRLESDAIIAYTGDTQPCEALQQLARNADLLIHEATFLQSDVEKARLSKHSTPSEAAETATSAGVKRLIMTHVNEDHESPERMIAESRSIFKATVAFDGMELDL